MFAFVVLLVGDPVLQVFDLSVDLLIGVQLD